MGARRQIRGHQLPRAQPSVGTRVQGKVIRYQDLVPGYGTIVSWFGTKPSQFQFRVRAVNKEGESEALTTASTTLAKNPYDTPEKMDVPEVTDWDAVSHWYLGIQHTVPLHIHGTVVPNPQ